MNKKLLLLLLIAIAVSSEAMEQEASHPVSQPNNMLLETAYKLIVNGTITATNFDKLDIPNELKQYLHSFYENIEAGGPSYKHLFLKVIKEKMEGKYNKEELNKLLAGAAGEGYENHVKFLIFSGADVNSVSDMHGNTSLIWAAAEGHIEIVKLLLANGAKVNTKNLDGETALTFAKQKGSTDIVNLLRENGAK